MKKSGKSKLKGGLRKRSLRTFVQADLREGAQELHNPGCGWYHMYTFSLASENIEEQPLYMDPESGKEQLVLLLMDLGKFRTCRLSEAALYRTEEILAFFQDQEKDLILRFTYDTQGKGLEKEPCSLSLIKDHMNQLGSIIAQYAGSILTLQGLFTGSWGEMHNSRFLADNHLTDLAETLYQAAQGSCYLAVRTPAQWRTIISCSSSCPGLRENMGLFNDGMFGSPTDLGTYKDDSRQEELMWQNVNMRHRPNGGEVLKGEKPIGYKIAAEEMENLHISYLNSVHQREQLDRWKEETVREPGCWAGLSGYEYIGRHLGYRFVVRRAELIKGLGQKKQLQITVENCGFADLCQEADCFLIMEHKNGSSQLYPVNTDARQWESGKTAAVQIQLTDLEPEAGSRLFLKLEGKKDGKPIRFANLAAQIPGPEGAVLLGEYR